MCKKCNAEWGSTKHLLFWQAEWFKRFLVTWYHIFNRKAYWKWQDKKQAEKLNINTLVETARVRGLGIDEGMRFEFDILMDKIEGINE